MPKPVVFSLQANIRTFQRGMFNAATAFHRVDTAARRTKRSVAKAGRSFDKAQGKIGKFTSLLGSAGSALTGLTQGFLAIGLASTTAFSVVTRAIESTIGAFAEFEARQAIISALFGASGGGAAALQSSVTKIGIASTFSVQQVQGLFRELGQLGTRVEDVDKIGEAVVKLAEVTASEPVIAAKLLQSQLNAFGRSGADAEKFMVALAQAANNSGARMEDLATALQFVSPAAASVGQSLEDILPAIMAMRNAGIEASVVGTSLRSAFVRLVKPTKQGAAALRKIGLTAEDVNPANLKLIDIVEKLQKGFGTLGDKAQRLSVAVSIFGRRAGANVFALTTMRRGTKKGAAALREMQRELKDTANVMARLDKIRNTLMAGFKRMSATFAQTLVIVGDIAARMLKLGEISKKLTEQLTSVFSLFDELRKLDDQSLREIGVKLIDSGELKKVFLEAVEGIGGPLGRILKGAFGGIGRFLAPPLFAVVAAAAHVMASEVGGALINVFKTMAATVFQGILQTIAGIGKLFVGLAQGFSWMISQLADIFKFGNKGAAKLDERLTEAQASLTKIMLKIIDKGGDAYKRTMREETRGQMARIIGPASESSKAGWALGEALGKNLPEMPTFEKLKTEAEKASAALSGIADRAVDYTNLLAAMAQVDREKAAKKRALAALVEGGGGMGMAGRFFGVLERKLGVEPRIFDARHQDAQAVMFGAKLQDDTAARLQTSATKDATLTIKTLNAAIQRLITAFQQNQDFIGPLPEGVPQGVVRRVSIHTANFYRANRALARLNSGELVPRGGSK